MKRRRGYFFVAFLSAAITFGCLTAFVNPGYSGMRYGYRPHWGWHHGYYDRYYNHYPNDLPPYALPDSAYRNDHRPDDYPHQ